MFSARTGIAFCLSVGFLIGCSEGENTTKKSQTESVTGNLDATSIDYAKRTHVFLVGYAGGMDSQFLRSAITRARRYRELSANQIVFFASPEIPGIGDGQSLKNFGIKVITDDSSDLLTDARIVKKLSAFGKIASIHVYSHSTPLGFGIDSKANNKRLGMSTDPSLLASLKPHFTSDAYATLDGCNGGFKLAPFLSQLWNIPVSGALVASEFQNLHTNGQWYFNDAGRFPPGGWATTNAISFATPKSCAQGNCQRLKADNFPYNGIYGDFRGGGLGFFKFFCNYGDGNSQQCKMNMARSLFSFPSVRVVDVKSSRSAFEEVVLDYLCPIDLSMTKRRECYNGIRNAVTRGDFIFNNFEGNPIECSMKGCQAELTCTKDSNGNPVTGSCSVQAPKNTQPKTIAQEYSRLMEGFDLLKNAQKPIGKIECPTGFTLTPVGTEGGQICVNSVDALGPFTDAMIKKCSESGGGTACTETLWAKSLAMRLWGTGLCPLGASYDPETTYCVEGENAFGPFPASLVSRCLAAGGGESTCRTARWNRDLLLSLQRP